MRRDQQLSACLEYDAAQHRDGKLATLDRGVAELIAEREARSRWVEWVEEL